MNALRFAFRQLRKSPGFALVAVLTLGLGANMDSGSAGASPAVSCAPRDTSIGAVAARTSNLPRAFWRGAKKSGRGARAPQI
jgi:hypothetical protein